MAEAGRASGVECGVYSRGDMEATWILSPAVSSANACVEVGTEGSSFRLPGWGQQGECGLGAGWWEPSPNLSSAFCFLSPPVSSCCHPEQRLCTEHETDSGSLSKWVLNTQQSGSAAVALSREPELACMSCVSLSIPLPFTRRRVLKACCRFVPNPSRLSCAKK